jgi:hypothetical protein
MSSTGALQQERRIFWCEMVKFSESSFCIQVRVHVSGGLEPEEAFEFVRARVHHELQCDFRTLKSLLGCGAMVPQFYRPAKLLPPT